MKFSSLVKYRLELENISRIITVDFIYILSKASTQTPGPTQTQFSD